MKIIMRLAIAALFLVSGLQLRSNDLHITEVMGSNRNVVFDEDGDSSDWIEIYNADPAAVNLSGWHLTDQIDDLALWELPDLTLRPGQFLIVFASGKNRRDPSSELHTNFRLERNGDLVILARPDGTVASQYVARIHVENKSFGMLMEKDSLVAVPLNTTVHYLVPTDDSLGLSWIEPGFDHGAWSSGLTGIGFDEKRTPTYVELIETDIAKEMRRVNSTLYMRFPFMVDDPAVFQSLLLRLKYEDGFVAYLNGEIVAGNNVPDPLTWESRSRGRRQDADAVTFQNFNLSEHLDTLVAGVNVLAIHGLNDSVSNSDYLMLPSLEAIRSVSLGEDRRYFADSTPGWENDGEGVAGVTRAPEFSHPGGAYPGELALELTVNSEGAVIRYTTNRAIPTETSPIYSEPITVDRATIVMAKAFKPGFLPSPTIMQTYIALHVSMNNLESNLPIMIVDTMARPVPPKSSTILGATSVAIYEPDVEGGTTTLETPTHTGYGGIKIRGSSSSGFPKQMYRFETWDEHGGDKGESLLGLPDESDWVLNGPYSDKSLMRNVLTYGWSNEIGTYAPRTKFFELYLNTRSGSVASNSYVGVYVLIEKIKVDKDRVNIAKLYPSQNSEPEITGGYILKIDRADPGTTGFTVPRAGAIRFDDPREGELSGAQRTYIRNYMVEFEAALFGSNFADPEEGYEKYIDVESFIDHFIMTESMKNIDGYRLSTFLHKDRGGKLKMGPNWDFNLGLGNADASHASGYSPSGWYLNSAPGNTASAWYRRLMADPGYRQRLFQRWATIRQGPFSTQAMLETIDRNVEILGPAAARNFVRWRVLGVRLWPNFFVGPTFQAEIDWMKNWVANRVEWIDSSLILPPEFSYPGGPVSRDFQLSITTPAGDVFYTLNGEDPRGENDQPTAGAIQYAGTFSFTENSTVSARTKIDALWSPMVNASFIVDRPALVISEILFDPLDVGELNGIDFEFVELQNAGDEPIDMSGYTFARGVNFDFPDGFILAPGAYAVVVNNLAVFSTLHDIDKIDVIGEYSGSLSNNGEFLAIAPASAERIIEFRYRGDWYPETREEGFALVMRNPQVPPETWGLAESWRASSEPGGSPGRADPGGQVEGLQRAGDIDQSGRLNISDAVGVLRLLFSPKLVPLPCDGELQEGGNLSVLNVGGEDQVVNLSDAVHILNFLFRQGPPPAGGTDCMLVAGCPDSCSS